jgi:hypothetical protein
MMLQRFDVVARGKGRVLCRNFDKLYLQSHITAIPARVSVGIPRIPWNSLLCIYTGYLLGIV